MNLDERLTEAKRRLDAAARACLQNKPGAAQEADRAMAEVAGLQALLKASVPQPAGPWAIADRLKNEVRK